MDAIDGYIRHIKNAVRILYERDSFLIQQKTELPCSDRVASYLRQENIETDSLKIDCEYNKFENGPKRLEGSKIRPDIILHERGNQEHNIFCIELKMSAGDKKISHDEDKLKGVTDENGNYKYKIGILIILEKNGPIYRYFKNGEEIQGL